MGVAAEQGKRTKPRIGGLLWQRNFALLWFGETVSGVGSAMAGVGVPLLAITVLRADTLAVSLLSAAVYLPWLLIGLLVGAWVDRLSPRPVLIIADVASAVLYAGLPIAAWLHILSIGLVLTVELLAGTAGVFFSTAYVVYLPSLVSAGDLLEGNAKLDASESAASIAGRGLGGLVASAVGVASSLLFNAGSFLVSAICLLSIRGATPHREHRQAARTTTVRAEIAEGLRFLWRDRLLRILTIWPAVANLAYGGILSLSVIFLVRVAHIGATEVGLLLAIGDVGGISGALVARRIAKRVGTANTLLLAVLVGGIAGLLIPLTTAGPGAAFFVAGSGLIVAAITVANIVLVTFRQTYIPAELLGRTTASQKFLTFGTAPLGALLAGTIGTAIGIRPALWVLVTIFALSGSILLIGPVLGRHDLPAQPAVSS